MRQFVIPPLDAQKMQEARVYIDHLTKPPGSLGKLEELAILLAGMTGELKPDIVLPPLFFVRITAL